MSPQQDADIPADPRLDRKRGERAEHVASWYFRLNGFLSIPGFVVHPDVVQRYPRTEADLLAVRLPYSSELVGGQLMVDDARLVALAALSRPLFLMIEVKTNLCNINGPWSRAEDGNMQRVIRRLGFATEAEIEAVAADMYQHLRCERESFVVQYATIGRRANPGQQRRYPSLLQVTWDDISDFLFQRFQQFPQKLPPKGRKVHEQWPDFGRFYGRQFSRLESQVRSRAVVWNYIEHGRA